MSIAHETRLPSTGKPPSSIETAPDIDVTEVKDRKAAAAWPIPSVPYSFLPTRRYNLDQLVNKNARALTKGEEPGGTP